MVTFVPNTDEEQKEMLKAAGYESFEDMLSVIPEEVRLKEELHLPEGYSEMQAYELLEELAEQNHVYHSIFRGAGAYDHYIPAIVKSVTSKEEFVTSYTPYQAEISQGVLQAIFEYQTMMCELTGMDVANASHYDGATAAAESLVMCVDRKRKKALVAGSVNPSIIKVMQTYCFGNEIELVVVPEKDGKTDPDALKEALTDDVACFVLQQPNYYGIVEDAAALGAIVKEKGTKFVMSVEPTSLALYKSPAECGADICVGDGQPLGLPLGFGGPYLGFMATTQKNIRKLPGRIVGETEDAKGNKAYVLTLQAREQHIRREKASSNICSNQALCALTSSVYLAALGKDGLKQVATLCRSKAHYLAQKLEDAGLTLVYDGEYYQEFVTDTGRVGADDILAALEEDDILGGLAVAEDRILWCTTEKNAKEDIDRVAEIVSQVNNGSGIYEEEEIIFTAQEGEA